MTHSSSCFCGEVKFEVTGNPVAMGYCHCSSCRHWSAGPVNAFTLWQPDAVKVTQGAANIGTYSKTPASLRKWCKKCGGQLFTDHPTMGLVDIYAAVLPKLKFDPQLHVHYQETVLRIRDGKPKMNRFRSVKQVPAETPISRAMSKELAGRGFKFVGPTIVYAFMQATGMVNDHLVDCYRHGHLAEKAPEKRGATP